MPDDRVVDFEAEAKKHPQRRPRQPRKPSAGLVEKNLIGGIQFANTVILFTPYAADALQPDEIQRLAHALTLVLMQHPELLQIAERAAEAAPYLVLLQTVVSIAIPRIMRRVIEAQAEADPEGFSTNANVFFDLIQGGVFTPPQETVSAEPAV